METESSDRGKLITKDIELIQREGAVKRTIAKARRLLRFLTTLEVINWPLITVGIALSLYLVFTRPTTLAYVILLIYILLWSTKLLRVFQKPRYGTVSGDNGAPLPNCVIQLTATTSGVESHVLSTIADNYGRFVLLAKPGVYTMIVTKEGYEFFSKTVESDEVNVDVVLKANTASSN